MKQKNKISGRRFAPGGYPEPSGRRWRWRFLPRGNKKYGIFTLCFGRIDGWGEPRGGKGRHRKEKNGAVFYVVELILRVDFWEIQFWWCWVNVFVVELIFGVDFIAVNFWWWFFVGSLLVLIVLSSILGDGFWWVHFRPWFFAKSESSCTAFFLTTPLPTYRPP